MESGLRLTERYRLVERLDDGGTMEVWRALDELLDRPVTVKLLTPERAGLHRGFQGGVNRAAGLSHAVLETIYDSDQTRDASGRLTSYVVTEFLDGETLAARLRRGRLTASETAGICGQVAAALDAAHTAGVTHGDLKPGKVMLLGDEVRLVDTGIGGIVRSARRPSGHRAEPVPVRTAATETRAADIRALGALISACLPPGASEDLSSLAARCMGARPPAAREIAAHLIRDDAPPRQIFTTAASSAPPGRTGTPHPPPPPRRRSFRLAAAALVVAVPATAAAAIFASAPRVPLPVPPPARSGAVQPPPATSPQDGGGAATTGVAGTRVKGALGRLRPIVSRGYASGEIRSDVAIDLTNVITNLEADLSSDRNVDVDERITLLHEKIVTRRRERGLSPDLADELNRVLATIRA